MIYQRIRKNCRVKKCNSSSIYPDYQLVRLDEIENSEFVSYRRGTVRWGNQPIKSKYSENQGYRINRRDNEED